MAQIYKGTIAFHEGGRSQEEVWEVDFLAWGGFSFTRTNCKEHIDELVNKLLPVLRPDVSIKTVTLTKYDGPGTFKGKARTFFTFTVNKPGTRTLPQGYLKAPIQVGILINKDSEVQGDNGSMFLRGTLTLADIEVAGDGFWIPKTTFDTDDIEAFCLAMKQDADADFRIVLPANNEENWTTGSRNIAEWVFAGISSKPLRNNRKTKKEKEDDAADAELVPFFKTIRRHIQDGLTIDDIWTGLQLNAEMVEYIAKYTAPIVAKVAIRILGKIAYAALRTKVPALPPGLV